MNDVINIYTDMLCSLNYSQFGKQKNISLTAQYAYIGKYYKTNNIRLMCIGRSANGGAEETSWNIKTVFDINNANIKAIEILSYWEKFSMDWVLKPPLGKKRAYQSFPFWHLTKIIINTLNKNLQENDWIHYLVWSNLYKIAPLDGGNPNEALCAAQLKYAKKILEYELHNMLPTHVIFITDNDWYSDFNEIVSKAQNEIGFKSIVVSRPEIRNKILNNERKEKIEKAFEILL